MHDTPSDWYRNFFGGLALELWRQAIPPEATAAEAEFLHTEFGLPVGSRLLDVPSGAGRHAFALAERGYHVTGIDLSEEFIAETQAKAAECSGIVDFQLGDMSELAADSIYDGAYCLGNSFGYLEWDGMNAFVAGVERALKPGAKFILETGAVAEALLPGLIDKETFDVGDMQMLIDNRYDAERSCLETIYTFKRGSESETKGSLHWVYTAGEIRRLLEAHGLAVLAMYGSVQRDPFAVGGHELMLVAQKPE